MNQRRGGRGAAWDGRKSRGLILVGVTLNMDERANTGQKVNARSSGGKKRGKKGTAVRGEIAAKSGDRQYAKLIKQE